MEEIIIPTVRELLDSAAVNYSDKPFIRYVKEDTEISRSFIDVRLDALALCRRLRHISPESTHIAVIGKTSYEYIIALTAVLISGNVLLPLAPDTPARECAELLERADTEYLFCEPEYSETAAEVLKLCPTLKAVYPLDEVSFDKIFAEYDEKSVYAPLSEIYVDPDAPAAFIYTSGTTGLRKAVMLSTKNLVSNLMYKELSFDEGDTVLSVLPMYHIFCFSGDFLKNLKEGMCVCLNGEVRDVGKNLIRFEPAVMRLVPMIAQALLQKVRALSAKEPQTDLHEIAERVFGKNFRWIFSGGAYLNPELAKAYDEFGIYLRQGYGMTEASCRISVPDAGTSLDSVGRVTSVWDVRIQGGEIQVKGPGVMLGYYKMPKETEEVITDDGYLRTGDIGYVTEDRQLFITGRLKNLIILSNGENVSPEELEKKLNAEPLVSESLVYGKGCNVAVKIYPDYEYAQSKGITDIEKEIEIIVDKVNTTCESSHRINSITIADKPLEKTSSGKIIRSAETI